MTPSGAPQRDEPGLEQEGIWDDPPSGSPTQASPPGSSADVSDAGLARRLTSTARSPGPGGLLYADVPNRIMALVLDVVLLAVVGFVLAWLAGGLVTEAGAIDATGGQLDVTAFLVVLVLQLLVSFAYFGALWTVAGTTLGMRLLGLRIGDESDGRAITWRQSAIRWLILGVPALLASAAVYVPNIVGLILGAVGVALLLLLLYTMAQSPSKQGLHDRSAHTIVTKSRRRAA
jgi:uncharacterized RDD family membrane protein YckC